MPKRRDTAQLILVEQSRQLSLNLRALSEEISRRTRELRVVRKATREIEHVSIQDFSVAVVEGRRRGKQRDWSALLERAPEEFRLADLRAVVRGSDGNIYAGIMRWIEAGLVRRIARGLYAKAARKAA